MLKTGNLCGMGISFGTGIGNALVIEKDRFHVPKIRIFDTKMELDRFNFVLEKLKEETKKGCESSPENSDQSNILNAYELIIEDSRIKKEVQSRIEKEHLSAEWAVKEGLEAIENCFKAIPDEYMRERASDIKDIKLRILRKLLGIKAKDISSLEKNTVIVCKEICISDLMKMDRKNVAGVVCEDGGKNSHAAIILRAMEIPAVFKVKGILENVKTGDIVTLNGKTGNIIVNPSETEVLELERIGQIYSKRRLKLMDYKNQISETKDGKKVEILANVSSKAEVDKAIENNADGIGLFRSEFLYIDKKNCPNEEEQLEVYKYVSERMQNKDIVIRTADLGGDKNLSYLNIEKEQNPFLGYRGIRICLDQKSLFKTQLRAILRSTEGKMVNIMLPMVSCYDELMMAKEVIFKVKQELEMQEMPCANKIKIGIMIETPAAAIIADVLAKECDFFSIGTNDLIQYISATDRNNHRVSELCSPWHPSVIRTIYSVQKAAAENGISCSICGEAAADEMFLPIILGIGIKSLSMSPSNILGIKRKILSTSMDDAKQLVEEILSLKDSQSIKSKLMEMRATR